jgi:hypothetical protein
MNRVDSREREKYLHARADGELYRCRRLRTVAGFSDTAAKELSHWCSREHHSRDPVHRRVPRTSRMEQKGQEGFWLTDDA